MHTGTLKKMALALTFWLALHMSSLRAQIFTNGLPLQADTTGTNPVDFEFRADGTMIAKGNYGVGSLVDGDQGDGTRLLWFPSLGAFRAGGITTGQTLGSNPWDSGNIGAYSAALGSNTTASGYYSLALGNNTTASGSGAFAAGLATRASGTFAFAIGQNTLASGQVATASGYLSVATGSASIATGVRSTATGYCSTASGYGGTASGNYSTASGYGSTASAYASFVVGMYNVGGGTATSWISTDPLFEIGNGTPSTPSDAVIVYKNGNVAAQGVITAAPGGDIPMYSGD